MSGRRSQGGYILPVVLLILGCVLLWGSTLLLTLSDQFDASSDMVKQEQSRLLACSGWNLAILQLEETGTAESFQIQKDAGRADVTVQQQEDGLYIIQVSAEAGGYKKQINGTVQLFDMAESDAATPDYMVQVMERIA